MSVLSASICSVTLIVAISAAIEEPTLAEIIKPVKTGPNSLVKVKTTILGIAASAENLEKPVYDCKARTIPEKIPVKAMIGIDEINTLTKYLILFLK